MAATSLRLLRIASVVADFDERRKQAGRAKVRAVSVQNSTTSSALVTKAPPIKLTRSGIHLGQQTVPLLSCSVHYFRHEPTSWRTCLEALRDMGCTMVDVYVPWSTHEAADGSLDFGQKSPALDVSAFLRIAYELGLYAIVRPGPHI